MKKLSDIQKEKLERAKLLKKEALLNNEIIKK